MRFDIVQPDRYIPKWEKNRSEAPESQIVVIHKEPTRALKERLLKYNFQYGKNEKGTVDVKDITPPDSNVLLAGMIMKIENLSYTKGGSEVFHIKDAKDLSVAPPKFDGLAEELIEYFGEILTKDIDEKN